MTSQLQTLQNPIPADEWELLTPLIGNNLLELGNKKNSKGIYKTYLQSIGINHVSVDWNGLDGALKLDLRKPLPFEPFDMVTNFGTTEHVSDQAAVWGNIHNMVKVGGALISMTPMEGDWWWHGEYYPRLSFFESFAKMGYIIERLDTNGRSAPNRNVYARLRKVGHMAFRMPAPETIFINKVRAR